MCEALARRVLSSSDTSSATVSVGMGGGGSNVVLLACGCFNPPTYMHLRMFEVARDTLQRTGRFNVMAGVISTVHDAYGKKELAASKHRKEMVRLAVQNSDWLRVSDWEMNQDGWTPTRQVLSYHQNQLNTFLSKSCGTADNKASDPNCDKLSWLSDKARGDISGGGPVQVKLLCGADVVESFAVPGVWKDEDLEAIAHDFGVVVITRAGSNPQKLIYESDLLTKHENNIHIVREWITNEVSATKLRRGLRRGDSIRYLVPDAVLEYIYKHGLYSANQK